MFLWDAKKDGSAWGYGSSCYDWDEPVCPSDMPFATTNTAYGVIGMDMNQFSYYNQFWCPARDASGGGEEDWEDKDWDGEEEGAMTIAMDDGQGGGMSLESYEEDGKTVFKLSFKNAVALGVASAVTTSAAAMSLF